MICLVRCDDRLIHGQCVVRMISDFRISHIVVADDFVASNVLLKNVFLLAAPDGIRTEIFSAQEAAGRIPALQESAENVLLLMRSPETALALYGQVGGLKNDLNIGPMSNRPGAIKATMYAYLARAEADAVKALTKKGIRVYFNQVISQKAVEWAEIQDRFS